MRRVFGPRTAIEAAFLVAVPVVSLVLGLGPVAIVAAAAVGYLLVLLVEAVLWRSRPGGRPRVATKAPPEPAPAPAPAAVEEPEPSSEPEPQQEPEPQPAPEAAPEPAPAPVLQAVPDPEPEPEPEPEVRQEPQPATVVPIGVGAEPRRWNLWDLERLTREHATGDAFRDEERTFLLMYLREFAAADGLLPVDFDGLVRDSFGELVGAR